MLVPLHDPPGHKHGANKESKSNGDPPLPCRSCHSELSCMTCSMPELHADLCDLIQKHFAPDDGKASTVSADVRALLKRRCELIEVGTRGNKGAGAEGGCQGQSRRGSIKVGGSMLIAGKGFEQEKRVSALQGRRQSHFRKYSVTPGHEEAGEEENDADGALESNHRCNVTVDPNIPRGKTGTAKRATPGLYLTLLPETPAIRVFDEWHLIDSLETMWLFRKVVKPLLYASMFVVTGPIGWLQLVFSPFAFMHMTNTAYLLFEGGGANANVTTFSNDTAACNCGQEATAERQRALTALQATPRSSAEDSATELPWHPAWNEVALAVQVTASVAIIIACCVWSTNFTPSVVRMLWRDQKARLVVTIGTTLVYTVAAATLLPTVPHILSLVARAMLAWLMVMFDAVAVFYRLRLTPKRFEQLFGGKKRGVLTYAGLITLVSFLLFDLVRHYLLLYSSTTEELIRLAIVNPLNGNKMSITNQDVADGAYLTSTIFMWTAFGAILTSHIGASTIVLRTKYLIDM